MTALTTPGIFLARSKITSPALSHETFTKWYEQVHIPDIFKISESFGGTGIISGFRYYSTSPQSTSRPYLAIYPLEDVGYLETKEFWSTPVEHAMLDEASGKKETKCFELAEFDMLPYQLLKVTQAETAAKGNINIKTPLPPPISCIKQIIGPAPFLTMLQFTTPGSGVENLPFLPVRDGIRRTRLYKTHWTEKNSLPNQREPPIVPEYMALLEVESEIIAEAFEASKDIFKVAVSSFRLVGAFGNTEVVY